ncbi:hypothetical protein LTR85_003565 [Meristemomyces frigidus]|nr:hypothetical protein LTR85_003565 [Meristemomyces frigidus]
MALTQEQVQIIRSTVPVLQEHGNTITKTFYDTLLKDVPDLNNVFNQANQANSHQAQALAGALYAYASHIDDLGALSPAVEKICQKHASLYIQPDQYKVVGEYLLGAMGTVLGSALTQEVLEAWGAAYWQLANLMIKREEQLFQDADGWTDWREFTIADKVKESDEITSFYLKPVDGKKLPPFLPGQYISVSTDVPKLQYLQSRQYSLSDSPKSDYYRVSIKKETGLSTTQPDAEAHPGYISNIMHDEKKIGDVVKVSHPAGEFFLDPMRDAAAPVVLISAGVGLTPMIAILHTLLDRDSKQRISFIHGARKTSAQAFGKQIKETVASHPNVTASIFIKNPNTDTDVEGLDYKYKSRVTLDVLDREKDLCLDNPATTYFVCGPDSFMSAMGKGLAGLGVDEGRIKMEVFGTDQTPVYGLFESKLKAAVMHPEGFVNSPGFAPLQAPYNTTIGFSQAEFTHAQLTVSTFEPHHSTTIVYPDCSLLKRSEVLGLRPMNLDVTTKERYEPLPLIRDNAVTNHAGRENEAEVSFFTRQRAVAIVTAYPLPHATLFKSPFDRLLQGMALAESFVGSTTLSMVTFQKLDSKGGVGEDMVRILRKTRFRRYGAAPFAALREEYVFSLATLYDDEKSPPIQSIAFLHALRILPQRSSDRAYSHVRLRLEMQGTEDQHVGSYGFKPARRENFERLLDNRLMPVSSADLEGEDMLCFICTGTLGEDAPNPVAVPCKGKHVLCKHCLLTWVASVGAASASCPQCRQKIFTDQREVHDLRFGLVNGIYEYDQRYTKFENFERSCSDLDQELAEDKQHEMSVHADVLIHIWDTLLAGSRLEDDNGYQYSTPEHLAPVSFQEWNIAEGVLRHQLTKQNGIVTTPGRLFHHLLDRVYGAFYLELCKAGLNQLISPQEMQTLVADPVNAACLDIRPGFKECFKRHLNRTLRFSELRRCCCSPGFHSHGLRA